MAPSLPCISGLPGRMAIFQKSSSMPSAREAPSLHEVVLADRGAAGGDEDIGGSSRALRTAAMVLVERVRDDAELGRLGALRSRRAPQGAKPFE